MSVLTDPVTQVLDAKQRQREDAHVAEMWAMTPEQRVAAMWAGELNSVQLYEWASKAPDEVPRLNGEFAFIALLTPEVADLEPDLDRDR